MNSAQPENKNQGESSAGDNDKNINEQLPDEIKHALRDIPKEK